MNPSRLRQLFARTLRVTLAAPLVLTGCGIVDPVIPSPPPNQRPPVEPVPEEGPGEDLTGYSTFECDKGRPAVRGLMPPTRPDVVELRGETYAPGAPPPSETRPVVSSEGTACETATDPQTCQSAFAALKGQPGFHRRCEALCGSYFLATTLGDTVAAYTSLEGLKSFLGRIDTPQEAVLVAFGQGLELGCDGKLSHGAVRPNPDGTYNVVGTAGSTCGPGTQLEQIVVAVTPTGEVSELKRTLLQKGDPNCAVGRRPEGLHAAADVACDSALGRYFAQAAHLEAASIQAFLRLHEELARHGADEDLRDAALASAMDEVMHTDVTTRLARRFGATPPPPRVETPVERGLFELALENGVEGCTRETYGALVAHYQALHARDEEVRGVMARIADDETRHAELSWAIDRWAHERLTDAERALLRDARRQAVETLREELAAPLDEALLTQAGMPPPEVAASLLDTLERELWA